MPIKDVGMHLFAYSCKLAASLLVFLLGGELCCLQWEFFCLWSVWLGSEGISTGVWCAAVIRVASWSDRGATTNLRFKHWETGSKIDLR